MIVVAKIGSSSITDDEGTIREPAVVAFCREVAAVRAAGHSVVAVTSGAIAAGLPALNLGGARRPRDAGTLQAVSAVGQSRLMRVYDRTFGDLGLVSGQVLLAQSKLRQLGSFSRKLGICQTPWYDERG